MKTYSTKTNAIRAARKELGSDAVAGLDFTVIEQSAGRWGYVARNAGAGATPALESAAPSDGAPHGADEAPAGEPVSTDATPADDAHTAPAAPQTRRIRESLSPTRSGSSKQDRLVEMLNAPEGVTIAEAAAALDWQQHTVRGAIAGALKKKLGLTIESEKVEGRGRVYRATS